MIGLDSYSSRFLVAWIDCLFEIRKIAVSFLWLSLPGHYRVTDEALLAETTQYDPSSFLWMFSLLLKKLIFYFYWNKAKISLTRKRKNKLTNGIGGMIIQLRAAIFERIRNVQIQALQTIFISLLSLSFLCVFHLWFKRYRRHFVNNDVTRNSVMCSLTLRHVTENRYVKAMCTFFPLEPFSFIELRTKLF